MAEKERTTIAVSREFASELQKRMEWGQTYEEYLREELDMGE